MANHASRLRTQWPALTLALTAGLSGCASLPPLPPGAQTLMVAEHTLAHSVRGEQGPTLVLLSGHGALGLGYSHVLSRLDARQRVAWVDRPGLGWGVTGHALPSPDESLMLMREALRAADVAPPYVLVGHSLGGAFALRWAQRWPEELRGLVLISPTHPGLWDGLEADVQLQIRRWSRWSQALPWLARLGLLSVWNPYDALSASLPEHERRAARVFARHPGHLQAMADEACLAQPDSALLAPLRSAPMPQLPIEWLIETEPADDPLDRARRRLMQVYREVPQVGLSTIATDHVGLLLDPAAAAQVAERIQQLLRHIQNQER